MFVGGGSGGGGSGSEMITQEDTIFVSGMNPQTTEDDIASHFGTIGIIKVGVSHVWGRRLGFIHETHLQITQKDKKTMKPKIWLYKNKETGMSKGEATVTYDDANAAASAINWFDNKDFAGATIRVSLAQRQNNWQKGGFGGGRGGNKSREGGSRFDSGGGGPPRNDDRRPGGQGGPGKPGGGQGGRGREGDWTCGSCNNTNFAWRNECNRCREPKPNGGSGGGGPPAGYSQGSGDRRGGGGGGFSRGGGQDRGQDRRKAKHFLNLK